MKTGWEIKKLGEVCLVIAGQSPEGKYYNDSGIGLPFYQGKKEFTEKFLGEPTTWTSVVTKEAKMDDILLSVRAPVGPINFSNQKICIGRGLAAIRAGKLIDKNFLFNFLLKHESEIIGNAGAVFNSINKNQIEEIKIPIPPLSEQRRIVSILDEAFASISQAKNNLERNVQNAKELFQSELNAVFSQKGEGWTEKKFHNLIKTSQIGLVKNTGAQKPNNKYRYLKMDSIGINNSLLETKYVYVNATESEFEKYKLHNGDFLFNTRNSYELVGKSCLFKPADEIPTLFNNNILRVKFQNDFDAAFVAYAFSSKQVKDNLEKMKSGTTNVVGIYYNNLKDLPIPVNSLQIQQAIVKKLDVLRVETTNLEKVYAKKLVTLEALKQSILERAFSGEL